MKKKIKINENLCVIKKETHNKTKIYIVDDGKKQLLSKAKTGKNYFSNIKYDKNYVIVHSDGAESRYNPKIAYNIKSKQKIFLDDEMRHTFKYMYIFNKFLDLKIILSIISDYNLNISSNEQINASINYLTNNNSNISITELKEYIIEQYPFLKKYKNLKIINDNDLEKIYDDLKINVLGFKIMPQIIDDSLKNDDIRYIDSDTQNDKRLTIKNS